MKKYELKYTKGEEGVFRMSTVENPATKTQLVMFDDELKAMEFSDDEKQIIYSVAMRPNMLIPRKDINGEPAMVFYSEETVKDLQQNFFKNNSHNGATINHDKNIRQDIYCFESWIVDNPEKDKATCLGLDVKKGDWILAQKVDNQEVWQGVKSGKLQGFSIEAYLEPVLTNNDIKMTQEEVDERIKAVIKMTAEEDAKKLEEEAAAKLAMEENEPPAPEAKTAEELQKEVDELTSENLELKAKIAELEGEAIEMSEEMAKGIKPNASPEKAYHEMSNAEKVKFNRGR